MHELYPNISTEGKILLVEIISMKCILRFTAIKIGMVFRRLNPFPTLSIYDDIVPGYRLNGIRVSKSVMKS